MAKCVAEAMVGSLKNFRKVVRELREKGIEFDAFLVNPESVEDLLHHVVDFGEDPFPRRKFSLLHPFRKRDKRPYFCGVPIRLSNKLPPGAIGTVGDVDEEQLEDVLSRFKAASKNGQFRVAHSDSDDDESSTGDTASGTEGEGDGVGAEMAKSANSHTLTDMMIQAMEGMDKAHHIVVLRFFDRRMDTFSNYNQLELQAALQQAIMRIMQGGGE